jgi:hypothetical protein
MPWAEWQPKSPSRMTRPRMTKRWKVFGPTSCERSEPAMTGMFHDRPYLAREGGIGFLTAGQHLGCAPGPGGHRVRDLQQAHVDPQPTVAPPRRCENWSERPPEHERSGTGYRGGHQEESQHRTWVYGGLGSWRRLRTHQLSHVSL